MRAREVKRAHQLKRHAQLAILSLEVIGLHLDEIDHSLVRPVEPCARGRGGGPLGEVWEDGGGRRLTDGDLDGDGVQVELGSEVLHHPLGIGAVAIEFIDECEPRHLVPVVNKYR